MADSQSSDCSLDRKYLITLAGLIKSRLNDIEKEHKERNADIAKIKYEVDDLLLTHCEKIKKHYPDNNINIDNDIKLCYGDKFSKMSLSLNAKLYLLLGINFPYVNDGLVGAITSGVVTNSDQTWRDEIKSVLKEVVKKISLRIVKEVIPLHITYNLPSGKTRIVSSMELLNSKLNVDPSCAFISSIIGSDSRYITPSRLEISPADLYQRVKISVIDFWENFKTQFIDTNPSTCLQLRDFVKTFNSKERGMIWSNKPMKITITESHYDKLASCGDLYSGLKKIPRDCRYLVCYNDEKKRILGYVSIEKDPYGVNFYKKFKDEIKNISFAKYRQNTGQKGGSQSRLVRFASIEKSFMQMKQKGHSWFIESVQPTETELELITKMNDDEKLRYDSSFEEMMSKGLTSQEATKAIGECMPITGIFYTHNGSDIVGYSLHQDYDMILTDDQRDLPGNSEATIQGMEHVAVQTWVLQNIDEVNLANIVFCESKEGTAKPLLSVPLSGNVKHFQHCVNQKRLCHGIISPQDNFMNPSISEGRRITVRSVSSRKGQSSASHFNQIVSYLKKHGME